MTPEHETLLREMTEHANDLGCLSWSAAYADILPEAVSREIKRVQTVPATYLRTRSDRVCLHPASRMVFEFDAKTNTSGHDVFVECLPVVSHLLAWKHFHLITLYGFRWPKSDCEDVGMKLDDQFRDLVDGVFIYERPAVQLITDMVTVHYKAWFPNAKLVQSMNRFGSGDPSIRISRANLVGATSWRNLMCELVGSPAPSENCKSSADF